MKIITIVLPIAIMFSLVGCGAGSDSPVTEQQPAAEQPTAEQPTAEQPTVEEPAIEEPAIEEPAIEEPAIEEPAIEEPAIEEPTIEEPTIEEPTIEEPAIEEPTLHITGHYYDKGFFDKTQSYEHAFSNNTTEVNVEIHSYVVIEFDEEVDSASITDTTVQIKRLHMEGTPFADTALNNNNVISGDWVLSENKKSLTFKPDYKPYFDRSTFAYYSDSKPNWNGLKPGYEYQVTVSEAITSTEGTVLSTPVEELSWTFQTADVDYGLYWFKSSTDAVKYVPGRAVDASYYAPENDTLVYVHGWQKESVAADYRREGFNHLVDDNTSGFTSGMTQHVDLVTVWKNKSWNFGAFYWNQMADDDLALGAPYKAESKIWNTTNMRYAVSPYSLNGSARLEILSPASPLTDAEKWDHDRQTVNKPAKPMSVLMAEVLESSLVNMANNEFRLAGHSLGAQMVDGAAYILSENNAGGALVPDRVAMIDPYWAGTYVADDYWDEHPAKALVSEAIANRATDISTVADVIAADSSFSSGYGYDYYNPGYAGGNPSDVKQPWNEEISRSIANKLALSGAAIAFYDVSQTSDAFILTTTSGGINTAVRDIAAISYLHTPWISGAESSTSYLGHRHVNGRFWYLWQMAFGAKELYEGFSASTDTASLIGLMNAEKSLVDKGRWSIMTGQDTATPEDDIFELKENVEWCGTWTAGYCDNSKSWQF
jgi:hypothetical protein